MSYVEVDHEDGHNVVRWPLTEDTLLIYEYGEFKRNRTWDDLNWEGDRYYFQVLPDGYVLRCRLCAPLGSAIISRSGSPNPELRFGAAISGCWDSVKSFHCRVHESND
jgi:hypothetical protein